MCRVHFTPVGSMVGLFVRMLQGVDGRSDCRSVVDLLTQIVMTSDAWPHVTDCHYLTSSAPP